MSSSCSQTAFNFDLCKRYTSLLFLTSIRNSSLQTVHNIVPKTTKTGTTIVGLIYKDGVVLGADTRATTGPIVADKNCSKIHYISPNIYCCGAGTAADTENVTNLLSSSLFLQRLDADESRDTRVIAAVMQLKQKLFQYEGHLGAALIVGGVDSVNGGQLYAIHPHGSTDRLPYVSMGSGSLCAMAVFEAKYRAGMEKSEAIALVAEAIESGVFNDLGSGSNVDVTVIAQDADSKCKVEVLRNYRMGNRKPPLNRRYTLAVGSSAVIESEQVDFGETVSRLEREIPALSETAAQMETE